MITFGTPFANLETKYSAKQMTSQFSPKVSEILSFSREEAARLASSSVGPEHLLLGLLRQKEGPVVDVFRRLRLNIPQLKYELEAKVRQDDMFKPSYTHELVLNEKASNILKLAVLEARIQRVQRVDEQHLLLAILHDSVNNGAKQILEQNDIQTPTRNPHPPPLVLQAPPLSLKTASRFPTKTRRTTKSHPKALPQEAAPPLQRLRPHRSKRARRRSSTISPPTSPPPPSKTSSTPSSAESARYSACWKSLDAERRTTPSSSVSRAWERVPS